MDQPIVHVVIARKELTLPELFRLKTGDTLPVTLPVAMLMLGDRVIAEGTINDSGNFTIARIVMIGETQPVG